MKKLIIFTLILIVNSAHSRLPAEVYDIEELRALLASKNVQTAFGDSGIQVISKKLPTSGTDERGNPLPVEDPGWVIRGRRGCSLSATVKRSINTKESSFELLIGKKICHSEDN